MYRKYKGIEVEVTRSYKIGEEDFVDLRELASGKIHYAVTPEFETVGNKTVVFQKKNKVYEFVEGTKEYLKFVEDNKLNPVFVKNCLSGVSKTHKGFEIHYK